jgi:hypothetical protein
MITDVKPDAAADSGCSPLSVRSDAMDNPSKHAWDLFLTLNQPAKPKNIARGEPDCSKRVGAPGTTAVWETWRNAGSEVYLPNGAEPPEWPDTSLPDLKPGSVPQTKDDSGKLVAALHELGRRRVSLGDELDRRGGMQIKFSQDGVFDNQGGFGETRLNKATYNFVRDQCLFSKEGQQRYAQAVIAGKKPRISFPVDSIEAKAAWLDFQKENIPADKWSTYYTAQLDGKTYGLTALHILTKDLPNWFWATFHHKDEPPNEFEGGDTHGLPPVLKGTVWENYRLGGTQIDFVTADGNATRLSDHYVEFNFQRSSCMTCHATATISATSSMPAAQFHALCAMTPSLPDFGLDVPQCKKIIGEAAFVPGTSGLLMERGVPDRHWYEKDGKPYYLQTDFVYSIPFRGQIEAAAPPPRCVW